MEFWLWMPQLFACTRARIKTQINRGLSPSSQVRSHYWVHTLSPGGPTVASRRRHRLQSASHPSLTDLPVAGCALEVVWSTCASARRVPGWGRRPARSAGLQGRSTW